MMQRLVTQCKNNHLKLNINKTIQHDVDNDLSNMDAAAKMLQTLKHEFFTHVQLAAKKIGTISTVCVTLCNNYYKDSITL